MLEKNSLDTKMLNKYEPLSKQEENIAESIIDSAFIVHKTLGPGLLEKVYEVCLCHELSKRDIDFHRQVEIPIEYDGLSFDEGLRIDILVEGLVICELKSAEKMHPVWKAQLISYLRLTNKRLGFIINFNVPVIKKGIERIIL
ncbi:GxxExxY protein [Planctomycetota bacterium]